MALQFIQRVRWRSLDEELELSSFWGSFSGTIDSYIVHSLLKYPVGGATFESHRSLQVSQVH
jgi:hypothetical protein